MVFKCLHIQRSTPSFMELTPTYEHSAFSKTNPYHTMLLFFLQIPCLMRLWLYKYADHLTEPPPVRGLSLLHAESVALLHGVHLFRCACVQVWVKQKWITCKLNSRESVPEACRFQTNRDINRVYRPASHGNPQISQRNVCRLPEASFERYRFCTDVSCDFVAINQSCY